MDLRLPVILHPGRNGLIHEALRTDRYLPAEVNVTHDHTTGVDDYASFDGWVAPVVLSKRALLVQGDPIGHAAVFTDHYTNRVGQVKASANGCGVGKVTSLPTELPALK